MRSGGDEGKPVPILSGLVEVRGRLLHLDSVLMPQGTQDTRSVLLGNLGSLGSLASEPEDERLRLCRGREGGEFPLLD